MDTKAQEITRAHDAGVTTLYKYCAYPEDDDTRRAWVDALLLRGELYFPTASQFNDPFDARPTFSPTHDDAAKQQYGLQKHFRTVARERGMTREQRKEVEKKLTPAESQRRLELIKLTWPRKLRSEYPMVCFSSEENNLLLWAHYAEKHTGIAVHFDATIAPWGAAQRVNYQREYPNVLIPSDLDDVPRLTSRCLLTKSVSWEYEKEFRFIDYPETSQPGASRVLDQVFPRIAPQTRLVPMRHITGVTIGATMPESLKDALVTKLSKRDPPLRIRIASLHRREFAVVVEDLTP